MTCDNLTPRPLFDTEVGQLKARIEELERLINRDGLTAKEQTQVKAFINSAVPSLATAAAQVYVANKFAPEIKAFILNADKNTLVSSAAQAEKIATQKVSLVQKTVNAVNTKVGKIDSAVTGLKTTVAANTQKIIANSRTLTKVSNVANSAFSKVGALFTKIAPILNIAGFLLNLAASGFTAYQIIQLMRRMDAQERATFLLTTALTFAGGGLLTAAYVKSLDAKITAVGVQQKVEANRIIGHVTGEHTVTRQGLSIVNSAISTQGRETRAAIQAATTKTNNLVSEARAANVIEHRSTREVVQYHGSLTRQVTQDLITRLGLEMKNFYINIMAAIAAIGASTGAAFNATVVARLDGILAAINAMQNTMLGKFAKLWDYLKMDRVLNVIGTAAAVHNAAMLSRNLAVSLVDTIGETLGLIGLKDVDGNAYDLNSMIGSAAEGLVIRLIGADAYQGLSKNWREANRIISAGAAVVMSIRSAQWALAEGVEVMSSWIAKIGNGLEDEGVVSDRKWPWMRENLDIKSFTALDKINNGLDSAEAITDSIYMTVSAGTEISEAVTQMRTSSENFKNTLDQDENKADQELQNKEVQSEAPAVTDDDLAEYEPEAI
jgi:hypothetical protein